jgi:hypothetical protein
VFSEDIERAVLGAELFGGEWEKFPVDLEAEVNLSALDVFFGEIQGYRLRPIVLF